MVFLPPGPLDPKFVKFTNGLDEWVLGKPMAPHLRWSPWGSRGAGGWFLFDVSGWDHLDAGLPAKPKTPLEARMDNDMNYRFEWANAYNNVQKVYAAVEASFQELRGRYPQSVWNPYTGAWREVHKRGAAADPVKKSGDNAARKELERRLREVDDLFARGLITDDVRQARKLEILREMS